VQEDTLSSYPLTIQGSTVDLGSMMLSFMESASSKEPHENDAIYSKGMLYNLVNALSKIETTENDLAAFKIYLEEARADEKHPLHEAISGLQYGYALNLQVLTKNVDGTIIETDAQKLLQDMIVKKMSAQMGAGVTGSSSGMASPMMGMGGARIWQEMLSGDNGKPVSDLLEKQYDLVYGTWPTEYDEIVLVVDQNNELSDMTLFALGLKSLEDMEALMDAALDGTELAGKSEKWSYEEICDMEFRVVLPGDCYTLDEATGTYTDLRKTDAGMRYLYNNGTTLKVSGIVRPNPDATSAMLSATIGYTTLLTEHIIEQAKSSPAVQAQLANPSLDIFTGLAFQEHANSLSESEKAEAFREHMGTLDEKGLAEAYVAIMSIPDDATMEMMMQQAMKGITQEQMRQMLVQVLVTQMGMAEDTVSEYVENMEDAEVEELFRQMVAEQVRQQYAQQIKMQLGALSKEQLAAALTAALPGYTQEQCAKYFEEVLRFSNSTYEDNLVTLGCLDLADPSSISIFAATFESKDIIEEAIAQYNEGVEELKKINYTDYVGLMMSSVTTIIDAITYVLISFVAISLVVSSIMIGVITLISVQERTKEIGILRAIGASKKNVSSMFNAETVMIGAASGGIGVGLTYLLCIPINAIIYALTDISGLEAYLPWQVALVLVGISILLSVFAGLIPAKSAAKKDPVVALRTE